MLIEWPFDDEKQLFIYGEKFPDEDERMKNIKEDALYWAAQLA